MLFFEKDKKSFFHGVHTKSMCQDLNRHMDFFCFFATIFVLYLLQIIYIFEEELIKKFNKLGIEDMAEVTQLNELKGDFINLEYKLPSGQIIKFWDDHKIYCSSDAEIVVLKRL